MTDRLDVELLALQFREASGACAKLSPVPGIGKLPYICTLPEGHEGAHISKGMGTDDRDDFYDSWVE